MFTGFNFNKRQMLPLLSANYNCTCVYCDSVPASNSHTYNIGTQGDGEYSKWWETLNSVSLENPFQLVKSGSCVFTKTSPP